MSDYRSLIHQLRYLRNKTMYKPHSLRQDVGIVENYFPIIGWKARKLEECLQSDKNRAAENWSGQNRLRINKSELEKGSPSS